jgi:hypothetical protein
MINFQNIENDEISEYIFNTVIKKIGNVNELNILSSNGSSFVFISSERENVYQYFNYESIAIIIEKIFKKIKQKNIINIKLFELEFDINIKNFICEFISYEPKNIIIWKKHLCLNSYYEKYKKQFILKNLLKLRWDIGKCLYCLHENNIYHGDPTIDNIGILNGNFILFDFDGSKEFENKDKSQLSKLDIYKFNNSIKFNTDNDKTIKYELYKNITSYTFLETIVEYFDNTLNYNETVNKLNELEIVY